MSQQPPPPPGQGGPWPSSGPQRPPRPSQRPAGQSGSHGPRKVPPPVDRPTEFIPRIDETTFIPRVPGADRAGPPEDPDGYSPRSGTLGYDPDNDTAINIGGIGAPGIGATGLGATAADITAANITANMRLPRRDTGAPGVAGRRTGMPPDNDVTSTDLLAGMDDRTQEHLLGPVPPDDRPPADPPRQRGRTALRTVGEVLITAGMVVLLFVVYELYVTNIFSAQKQANATSALNKEWDTVSGPQRTNHYDLTDGSGIAKLYIPALGRDFHFTVIEGTNQADLAIGPGHYPGSALPGQPGDFAVAGHRVGEGAPFDDLGLVQSCDAIVIETQTDWYVYRMLPMVNEQADWATGKGKTAQCSGPDGESKVAPLTGIYAKTVGQEIVLPSEGDVVAAVPHYPSAKLPAGQELSLLTLTTCNPKFSAAQRMILHAVLVKDWKKNPATPNQSPPELKETS